MTVLRLEHIGIVVDDLAAATAFFVALGLEVEGETSVEGDLVDRINGLEDVRADVVILRTPDGPRDQARAGQVPLARMKTTANGPAPANAPGIRHILFVVDAIEESLAALSERTAASWSASWSTTRTCYWLCYVAGPAGIIVELAEKIG